MTAGSFSEIAVAVVEHQGRYLVGRRTSEPLAGRYEFPGGKIRDGETPEEAAVRECGEESGLAVCVVGTHATVEHEYSHGRLRLHFFACALKDDGPPPRTPFSWMSLDELKTLDFPDANRALVRRLVAGHDRGTDGQRD